MAIETLGAALRQINRPFADGVVAGGSDLRSSSSGSLPEGGRRGLRGAGGRHG